MPSECLANTIHPGTAACATLLLTHLLPQPRRLQPYRCQLRLSELPCVLLKLVLLQKLCLFKLEGGQLVPELVALQLRLLQLPFQAGGVLRHHPQLRRHQSVADAAAGSSNL